MEIDFSPILQSPLYAAEKKTLQTTGKQKSKAIYLLFLLPPLWPFLLIYVIWKIPEASRKAKQRQAALVAFAAKNNFQYQGRTTTQPVSTQYSIQLPYTFYGVESVNHQMTGTINGLSFEYVNISIMLHGPNDFAQQQQETMSSLPSRSMNILRLQLPVTMPRLLANSKRNDLLGLDPTANNFVAKENYVLEGDFPTYYTVRGEQNEQIDIYSILSPEVMQALKENAHYDLWVHDAELALIDLGTDIEYFAGLPLVFANAQLLLKEIDRLAHAIPSVNPNNPIVPANLPPASPPLL